MAYQELWNGSAYKPSQGSVPTTAADAATAAANTAVVIVLPAAGVGIANVIGGIVLSYTAAPTGGRITILDGVTTIFDLDIILGGPTLLFLRYPKRGSANTSMTITLAAGSGAVVGKLNIIKWTE